MNTTEKLVRNGPGQRILAEGGDVRVADSSEMPILIARKIVEEAQEVLAVLESSNDRRALVSELADLDEVVGQLREVFTIYDDELRRARVAKLNKEGGFDGHFVWRRP